MECATVNIFNKQKTIAQPWDNNKQIKSVGVPTGAATKKEPVKYTGDKMIGIGTMHKSNSVPVFSSDEARDIATMRRS